MISLSVPLILASQSPRRSLLLRQIGLSFVVQPSMIDEKIHDNLSFADNVKQLSLHKAQDVAQKFEEGVVIGSDTIVVIDNTVLGKPGSPHDAFMMLKKLSGKTHTVYTGFAILDVKSKKAYIDVEQTDVTFRRIHDAEISNYIAGGSPMDKAGAYGIQDDFGAVFVEKINGCYYTVVGFPLAKFYVAFTQFVNELGHMKGSE